MTLDEAKALARDLNAKGPATHVVEPSRYGGFTVVAQATGAAKGSAMRAFRQMYEAVNE